MLEQTSSSPAAPNVALEFCEITIAARGAQPQLRFQGLRPKSFVDERVMFQLLKQLQLILVIQDDVQSLRARIERVDGRCKFELLLLPNSLEAGHQNEPPVFATHVSSNVAAAIRAVLRKVNGEFTFFPMRVVRVGPILFS